MIDREALKEKLYALDSDVADIPFWEACERGEFLLRRCNVCGCHYWPAVLCTEHGARDMAWVPASGRGEVHVHTIMRHAYSLEMKSKVPFNVSVIKLEEGPFFHSNVIDCPPEEMRTGLPVEVVFTQHENGMTIPQFKRRG